MSLGVRHKHHNTYRNGQDVGIKLLTLTNANKFHSVQIAFEFFFQYFQNRSQTVNFSTSN